MKAYGLRMRDNRYANRRGKNRCARGREEARREVAVETDERLEPEPEPVVLWQACGCMSLRHALYCVE